MLGAAAVVLAGELVAEGHGVGAALEGFGAVHGPGELLVVAAHLDQPGLLLCVLRRTGGRVHYRRLLSGVGYRMHTSPCR